MQYQPGANTTVDSFLTGKVVRDCLVRKKLSPSILVFDRKAVIEPISQALPPGSGLIDLEYASSSYVVPELDRTYLFAIAGHRCVGFLEVNGDQLVLPDGSSATVVAFTAKHLHHPFPDYYGFNDR